ncbi:rho GDP-dissociation inhibitor 3-like, partial [Cyanistes caeruleus]|uniref:rho GDP-dissociation inhibitor 3-like n=1 Tax=Cyanistes caeruleus TaxID=156563 RepID=UPI000CDB28AD
MPLLSCALPGCLALPCSNTPTTGTVALPAIAGPWAAPWLAGMEVMVDWAWWVRSGPCCLSLDASVPNVQVTKLTLMCEQAPGPITMDLTGDLEELRGRAFVLKEGVDYRVKVSFKVNREIVCGLRCLHLTYRRGRP